MKIKANILIGVAGAALMAVPAMGQTQTAPPATQDAQPGQSGQRPGAAIIRIVPGAPPQADDDASDLTEEGVTQEEAAEAEPTLVEPEDGASTSDGVDDETGAETPSATGSENASGAADTGSATSPMAGDGATGDATQGETNTTASGATDGAGAEAQPVDLGRTAESYGQSETRDAIAFGENERQDGAEAGATADGSAVEEAIERADAPTTGVTDTPAVEEPLGDANQYGFDFEGMDEGATEGGDSSMPGMSDGMGGMGGIDMNAFARELFEQGYRQGYVAALTEMRMRAARDGRMRMQEQRRAQERRQPPRGGRVVVTEDADGNAIIMLPPGVSPRDFLQQMQRRSN